MGNAVSRFRKTIQQGNEVAACQIYVQNPDIREKLNPNSPCDNLDNNTLLHYAAKYCMKSLLRDFLRRGGNPNTANKDGQTSLHMLMIVPSSVIQEGSQKRLDCLHLLLKWKGQPLADGTGEQLDVAAVDKRHKTALHYAATSGLLLCVQCLISEDSALFVEDEGGLTACDLAEENHHLAVAAILETKMVFCLEKENILFDARNSLLHYIDDEYFGLCALDLQESKDQLIVETSDMLQVPLFTAEALLQKHSWSREKLLESWMCDPVAICEQAGVELSRECSSTDRVRSMRGDGQFASHNIKAIVQTQDCCNICEEHLLNYQNKNITEMSCGHMFCDVCWDRYLSSKISNGQTHNILCPGHKCDKLVPVEMTEKLVSRDMAKIYLKFDIKAFVDTNPNIRWCPHPNCGRAIKISETSSSFSHRKNPVWKAKSVDCGNGHYFCWLCLGDAHEPCSCEMWQKWSSTIEEMNPQKEEGLSKERSSVATAYWLITNSKKCPNCLSHIQKNEGCNHMTCAKCKHDFCWVCMEAWKIHNAETGGYFRCNRFEVVKKIEENHEKEQNKIEKDHDQVQKVNRFLHYYTRCKNHENSFQLEARLLTAVREKMICLQKTARELAYIEHKDVEDIVSVQFLEDAVKELLRSRQILKGSYPYGYFLDNIAGEIIVFESMQDEVEQATESLSRMIARPFLKSTRSQIINATVKLSRKRKEFLTAISRGLIPDDDFNAPRIISAEAYAISQEQTDVASKSDTDCIPQAAYAQYSDLDEASTWYGCETVKMHTGSRESDDTHIDDIEEESGSIVVAEFDYVPDSADELAILSGDVINVLKKRNDGWWKGRCNGRDGWFPSTFAFDLQLNPSKSQLEDERSYQFQQVKVQDANALAHRTLAVADDEDQASEMTSEAPEELQ